MFIQGCPTLIGCSAFGTMLPPSRRTASLVLLWISIMTTTVTMMKVTEDEYGFPITFECQNVALNETDTVTSITMEFFYDLAFARPDDMNELDQVTDLARAFVEGSLLQQLAAYYGFWDGQACEGQLEDLVWFIKLSSLEKDIPNPNLCEYPKTKTRLPLLSRLTHRPSFYNIYSFLL